MMEKQAQNIQEAFLNNARKEKIFLTIYLMSGVKLSGKIKSFDKYSAISTVVVSRPFHTGPPHNAGQGTHTAPGVPAAEHEE